MTAAGTPETCSIIVPLDFSDASRAALRYARDLAIALRAELRAIHVCETPWTRRALYAPPPLPVTASLFALAGERLTAELREAGLPPETPAIVRVGDPVSEVLRYLNEQRADLIVMGTHGWHGAGGDRHRLGRVTRRVVHEANCPVVTVRAASPGCVERQRAPAIAALRADLPHAGMPVGPVDIGGE